VIVLCYSSDCLSKICSKRLFLPLNYYRIYHEWRKKGYQESAHACVLMTWWRLEPPIEFCKFFPSQLCLLYILNKQQVINAWHLYMNQLYKKAINWLQIQAPFSELVGRITTFSGSFCTQDVRREREGNRTDMISSKVEYNLVGNLATPGMKTYLAAV